MMAASGTPPGRIRELVPYFLRLGLLGFGGPVALVGQMERELVSERGWLTKEQMREAIASTLVKLMRFFFKAGSLTFVSGLMIVPFLEQGLVREYGWLDQRQFLIAVAIGMIGPGPRVITATFVGYLVGGFWGSLVSTVGIFLPSFILVLIAAPILARHHANTNVQGFVKGVYGAAIGTILGACVLLGRIAIRDWLDSARWSRVTWRLVPLESQQPLADRRHSDRRADRLHFLSRHW
jgi:chromate transport protein ChrA